MNGMLSVSRAFVAGAGLERCGSPGSALDGDEGMEAWAFQWVLSRNRGRRLNAPRRKAHLSS
jgi:hypothetical protein